MASIKILTVSCLRRISRIQAVNTLNTARNYASKLPTAEELNLTLKPEIPPRESIEYVVSKCPKEWKLVERLIPPKVVPDPTVKPQYPSGWQPPKESSAQLPYFVERSKNHMPGVYLVRQVRGQRVRTKIRKVSGDIWALERDLKEYLEEKHQKEVISQINEVTRCIWFKGDYVNDVIRWMTQKGF
ncbi:probable 39S ribosomal protein L49, mitochondrial isoform X2 [Ischnura elegans]|uniref:probable 39S ribosomal protein L49, mitochondrial isoform X2 n=1 Tax=Ischnura elegans TaxID=197161 RepID=UPI001ED88D3C|nr:probable 39S ribosomal protein L49, mitochondrial isoform X2 [Ischnura elegans]